MTAKDNFDVFSDDSDEEEVDYDRILPRIRSVEPLFEQKSVRVTWSDGKQDIVRLADEIDALQIFAALEERPVFDQVHVGSHGWSIAWDEERSLSVDTLWQLAREQAGDTISAASFRQWRKAKGLSLSKAADAFGISRRSIAYYESGQRTIPKLVILACLGIDAKNKSDRSTIADTTGRMDELTSRSSELWQSILLLDDVSKGWRSRVSHQEPSEEPAERKVVELEHQRLLRAKHG